MVYFSCSWGTFRTLSNNLGRSFFLEKINGFQLSTSLAKSSTSDILQGSEHASFNVVNSNVDVEHVVSTFIWRCLPLRATLKQRWNISWKTSFKSWMQSNIWLTWSKVWLTWSWLAVIFHYWSLGNILVSTLLFINILINSTTNVTSNETWNKQNLAKKKKIQCIRIKSIHWKYKIRKLDTGGKKYLFYYSKV